MENIAYLASIWVLPVLFAITLHEAAHGWVAWRLGDPTAKMLGRVSFNPLRHIDLFGTILLPAMLVFIRAPFLFGWAKPVPVDFRRLGHPRRDMALVAAAGPAANILLAIGSAAMLHLLPLMPVEVAEWTAHNLLNSIHLNLVLAVLNMLPLPPLDGGRVAVGLLPDSLARPLAKLERFGLFILIGLLFLVPMVGDRLGVDLDIFAWLVHEPVNFLTRVIAAIVRIG